MNSFAVALCAVLAVAHAGYYPTSRTSVLHGPSTSAQLVGPDGSHIVASAPGGKIVASEHAAQVLAAAPTVYSAPVAAYSSPYYAGSVYTSYAAPAHAYVAAPVAAYGYHAVAPGSGHEGQYVHDYTEKLYDDGSYKPEVSERLYDDGSYRGESVYVH